MELVLGVDQMGTDAKGLIKVNLKDPPSQENVTQSPPEPEESKTGVITTDFTQLKPPRYN